MIIELILQESQYIRTSLLFIVSHAFLGTSKHLPTWERLVQYPRRFYSFRTQLF